MTDDISSTIGGLAGGIVTVSLAGAMVKQIGKMDKHVRHEKRESKRKESKENERKYRGVIA